MADMTAAQIIDSAYRKVGIASPTVPQDNQALQDLQNMLALWSADGLLIPYSTTENFTLTVGQAVYTIGVTGDSPDLITATGRPVKISDAFIRVSGSDYPIKVNMTKSEYHRIASKDAEGRPRELYYDPQYPTGKIRFDYECDSAYDFHLVSQKVLTEPSTLATAFSIPLEYNIPLIYNLAIHLTPDIGNKVSEEIFEIARASRQTIENRNANDMLSDSVGLDPGIVVSGLGIADITVGT